MRRAERHVPCESWEARVVAIECDPLAAPFDGKRCKPGIAYSRPSRRHLDAEASEDFPVPLARFDNLAMGLSQKLFAEPKSLLDCARRLEDTRVRGDPDDRAQNRRRQAESSIARYQV